MTTSTRMSARSSGVWRRTTVKRWPWRRVQINRFGMPTATELQSSNDLFFPTLAWPSAQARRAKLRDIGYGLRSDFELNFGRYLPALGRADDDDTDTKTGASSLGA